MCELRIWLAGVLLLLAFWFGLKLLVDVLPSAFGLPYPGLAIFLVPFVPPFLILMIGFLAAALLRVLYLVGKALVQAVLSRR
jgi:hypothetical protein